MCFKILWALPLKIVCVCSSLWARGLTGDVCIQIRIAKSKGQEVADGVDDYGGINYEWNPEAAHERLLRIR